MLNSHRPKRLEPTPNDILYSKRKKKPHETVGGVLSQHSQILCPPGGQPIDWKRRISQRFSHKIGSWAPRHAPQHEGPALRGGTPEHLALEVSGARESPLLEAQTRFCTHWEPAQSSQLHSSWGWTCGSWRISCGDRGWLWPTGGGVRTGVAAIFASRPGSNQQPTAPVLECLRRNNPQERTPPRGHLVLVLVA